MNRKHIETSSHSPRRRPVIVAAVVAVFLMLISGVGYRVLAARLEAPVNSLSISPDAFKKLPLHIGDWKGQDVALDEAIVRATDTDAHLNRRYLRQNALDSIGLYIAYGARARDLMPHRPEVCYTGAGWTLVDRHSMDLPLSDGIKLPCRILQFKRGTLNTEKTIVLDYYIVDGQYCGDVSLLRSKAWRGSGTIEYVAQVQIIAPFAANQAADSEVRSVSDFAIESAPFIIELFENSQEDNLSDESMFEGGENG